MVAPTQEQLAAMARLHRDSDFRVVLDYLTARKDALPGLVVAAVRNGTQEQALARTGRHDELSEVLGVFDYAKQMAKAAETPR